MAAHVKRDDVIIAGEVARQVIERVRVSRDPVQENQRRLRGGAPVEIVEAQTVDRRVAVGVRRLCRGRDRRREDDEDRCETEAGHFRAELTTKTATDAKGKTNRTALHFPRRYRGGFSSSTGWSCVSDGFTSCRSTSEQTC